MNGWRGEKLKVAAVSGSLILRFKSSADGKTPMYVGVEEQFNRKVVSVGRGCGQVVSVLAFYSNDPGSNPAEVYSFYL